MKVITLLNEKGGVGKTTMAVTLACGLAMTGARVMLIDVDPQANATWTLGVKPYPGVYNLIIRNAEWEDEIREVEKSRIYNDSITGAVYVLGGNIESRNISGATEELYLVHERIEELKGLGIIDYVIFDTPPTPSLLHASIYMATDSMLIPTQPEATSLLGLGRTVKFREYYTKQRAALDLPPIELMGVIPTMTTYNAKEHTGNFGTLVEVYGQRVIWRGIPRRIAWGEASAKRNSIFAHALENPQAEPAAKDAWNVVKGVLEYEPSN